METKVFNHTADVVNNYLALSQEFQEQHFYNKAEETLLLALEKAPNHPLLLARLANLYIQLDMPERTMEILHQLIRSHPSLTYPYYLRGFLFEQRKDYKKAIADYYRALDGNKKDIPILKRLLPLLLITGQHKECLERVNWYQQKLKQPYLFADLEAEALLKLGNYSAAFNRKRESLLQDPQNRILLKQYLQLSNHHSKRNPREVYHILRLSLPDLAELSDEELDELEVDYYIERGNFENAIRLLENLLSKNPDSSLWKKKLARTKIAMGDVETGVMELTEIFIANPNQEDVREELEEHYRDLDRVSEWITLVSQLLREDPQNSHLFDYLREVMENPDWLAICQMDFDDFITQVEKLKLVCSDITDDTYAKIPAYALEHFIRYMAVHQRIPDVITLWKLIVSERQKKQQLPPFVIEDLEAAYPVWIFGLHIYFLFKSYSTYKVAFFPGLFQNEQIAVTLDPQQSPIEVDISNMLSSRRRQLKPIIRRQRGFRWRWQKTDIKPEIMLHEVFFYSPVQFQQILERLEKEVTAIT
ncbi:MAG: hypothetical protein D6748_05470 [Calditrichaeota bacterium]|nr:MAG: hypothetical protein D6748_05470 [Calditrichota bacterium]